ncbi:Protein MOTHER of FT and TFL1 [Zea mays]|uniref:Protein MOTHER of FT and TFL1 n=1 Tax=Zea mays TaxID=4577 RepID=A0A1D6FCZ5_MAIZE|nr:Protein MOTHER of FT and TFL1 [Zea mays]
MARFVDPLVVGRVIGEVVDLFVPSISMTVAYDGPKDISNGCLLKPSATGDRANFKTRAFAAAHELGLPTAVVYFNAQKEPASRRR